MWMNMPLTPTSRQARKRVGRDVPCVFSQSSRPNRDHGGIARAGAVCRARIIPLGMGSPKS